MSRIRGLYLWTKLAKIRRYPTLASLGVLAAILVVTLPLLRPMEAYETVAQWAAAAPSLTSSSPPSTAPTSGPVELQVLSISLPIPPQPAADGVWQRVNEPAHIVLRFEQDQVLGFYKTQRQGASLNLSIAADYSTSPTDAIFGVIRHETTANHALGSEGLEAANRAGEQPEPVSFSTQLFSAKIQVNEGQLTISDVTSIDPPETGHDSTTDEVLKNLVGEYELRESNG